MRAHTLRLYTVVLGSNAWESVRGYLVPLWAQCGFQGSREARLARSGLDRQPHSPASSRICQTLQLKLQLLKVCCYHVKFLIDYADLFAKTPFLHFKQRLGYLLLLASHIL